MNGNIKCPVCGGTEIMEVHYTVSPGGNGGYWTSIPLGMFSAAFAHRYVCKNCGYLLEFFSKDDIIKIQNKYGK